MYNFGISIYPDESGKKRDFAYMELASTLGYKKMFTCMLSADKEKAKLIDLYCEYVEKAHELGLYVIADTNPAVFKLIGATPYDISVFHQIGIDALRLDTGFGVIENSVLTNNPFDIQIVFSASYDCGVSACLETGAKRSNMAFCHNFYPLKHSALALDYFIEISEKWKSMQIPIAAFVSSNVRGAKGPWELCDGLPTLEMHRNLPIDLQVRHLISTGVVTDIIISNCYASDEELESVVKCGREELQIKIETEDKLSEEEETLLFSIPHFARPDRSDELVRSYFTKKAGSKLNVPERISNVDTIKKGDVLMVNEHLPHYRGEVQIALTSFPKEKYYNVIGKISDQEIILLKYLKPGNKFRFI